MTQALIHFGLAKTATTYLQRNVFSVSKNINYLGKPFLGKKEAFLSTLKHVRLEKPTNLFINYEKFLRDAGFVGSTEYRELAQQLRRACHPSKLNVWSHEGLLRPTRRALPFNRIATLRNMKSVFNDAGATDIHVMVVIRSTKSLMGSYAKEFYHDVEHLGLEDVPLEKILDYRLGRIQDRHAELLWRLWYQYFDFKNLLDDLNAEFGKDKVKIFNYDSLSGDWSYLNGYLQSINKNIQCTYPDVKVNETKHKSKSSQPMGLEAHLKELESFELAKIFPINEKILDAAEDR